MTTSCMTSNDPFNFGMPTMGIPVSMPGPGYDSGKCDPQYTLI